MYQGALRSQALIRLIPWAGLGIFIISPLFTSLVSRKLTPIYKKYTNTTKFKNNQ